MFVAEEAKAKRDELNLSPQNLSKITSKYIAEVFKSSYKTFFKITSNHDIGLRGIVRRKGYNRLWQSIIG